MPSNFFKSTSFNTKQFQHKLKAAIALIERSDAEIAKLVIAAIRSKKLRIRTFFEFSKKAHFLYIRKFFLKDGQPKLFPPTRSVTRKIESALDGLYFSDNQTIYIASRLGIKQMAQTLIHEVTHFLNSELYDEELETKGQTLVDFLYEIRSVTAEKIFAKNGARLLRSDVKKIEDEVRGTYPQFIEAGQENKRIGFVPVFSTF